MTGLADKARTPAGRMQGLWGRRKKEEGRRKEKEERRKKKEERTEDWSVAPIGTEVGAGGTIVSSCGAEEESASPAR